LMTSFAVDAMVRDSGPHEYAARSVRKRLSQLLESELRRRAPDVELTIPSDEPDVIRLEGLGVVWVDERRDGTFALVRSRRTGK
jgi:hypothetical protein